MSTLTLYTINCDGCSIKHAETHDSIFEARAAAYAAGWRFPAKVKVSGENARETNDACPNCAAAWEPRPATNKWTRRGQPPA